MRWRRARFATSPSPAALIIKHETSITIPAISLIAHQRKPAYFNHLAPEAANDRIKKSSLKSSPATPKCALFCPKQAGGGAREDADMEALNREAIVASASQALAAAAARVLGDIRRMACPNRNQARSMS